MNTRNTPSDVRSAVEKAALLIGIVFLLVGVLGFIPGVTTNYDSLSGAGHHSEAKLLGIFQVSYLHNAVHLCSALPDSSWRAASRRQKATSWSAESSICCSGFTG